MLISNVITLSLCAANRKDNASAQAMSSIQHITNKQDLLNQINSHEIVIVHISADWCGVCKRFEKQQILESLAKRNPSVPFLKVNESVPGVTSHFKINAYPTTLFIANGQVVSQVAGIKPIDSLQQEIEKARAVLLTQKKVVPVNKIQTPIAPTKTEVTTKKQANCPDTKTAPAPQAQANAVIEIKSEAQFDELLKKPQYKVIDFYTVWCGPCKTLKPIFAKLAAQYSDVLFISVEAEQQLNVAKRYSINGYPTIVILDPKNNKIRQDSGFGGEEALKRRIDQATGKSTNNNTVVFEETVRVQ